MSSADTSSAAVAPPHEPSLLAGVLSYLVPGLGQIVQGRIGKGVLFMVCLLGMFTLGQAMGNWRNVYIPLTEGPPGRLPERNLVNGIYQRWHYAGQFWIGVAAWPAIWQFFGMPVPTAEEHPFWHNFQRPPLSIAIERGVNEQGQPADVPHQVNDEGELNRFLVNSDKGPDLGWVYTVIAGMLNVLVIYDAYAGPAHVRPRRAAEPAKGAAAQEVPA